MPWSTQEAVELFHLLFLRALCSGPDKDHYLVKGGCDLRFFFGSIRYSEDLDLDVRVTAPATLRNKIDRVLDSPALRRPLAAAGMAIEISAPKQTETPQRWKIGLRVEGRGLPLPTKIEFSRRTTEGTGKLDAVSSELIRHYRLTPTLVCHYPLQQALQNLWTLGYDDYAGQVLSFLAPDESAAFASREAWDAMQVQVAAALEAAST